MKVYGKQVLITSYLLVEHFCFNDRDLGNQKVKNHLLKY